MNLFDAFLIWKCLKVLTLFFLKEPWGPILFRLFGWVSFSVEVAALIFTCWVSESIFILYTSNSHNKNGNVRQFKPLDILYVLIIQYQKLFTFAVEYTFL